MTKPLRRSSEQAEPLPDRIQFFLRGTPQSWRAPQFNRATGNAYKSDTTGEKAWQESIWGQSQPYAPAVPWTGPVAMTLALYIPIPQSWPKWKKAMVGRGKWYCDKKPDWVNLAKCAEDALKGIFFADDAQVAKPYCPKWWADRNPGIYVILSKLPALPDRKPK